MRNFGRLQPLLSSLRNFGWNSGLLVGIFEVFVFYKWLNFPQLLVYS